MLRNFEKRGLIERTASASDARQSHLALSARGRRAYAPLERRSQRETGAMLTGSPRRPGASDRGDEHDRVAARRRQQRAPEPRHRYTLRAPVPGDFGWIVKRHAELYARRNIWLDPFEGLCAQIVADFANKYDPKRERCWIAEMDGENVGCVFLAKDSATVARIRLLLVDPKARGLGLGATARRRMHPLRPPRRLRKITLWTHSVLTAARHIYQKAGFRLMRTERHSSWGRPVWQRASGIWSL